MCRNSYTDNWKGKRAPVAFLAIEKQQRYCKWNIPLCCPQHQGRHGSRSSQKKEWLDDSWLRYEISDPKDAYSEENIKVTKEVLDLIMPKTFDYIARNNS